jgi:hypothetical protein
MGSVRHFRDVSVAEPIPNREDIPRLRRLAHEFNNVLTSTNLYCGLLTEALQSDPRLLGYANEIRLAAEHGALVVEQLRALAVESGEGAIPALASVPPQMVSPSSPTASTSTTDSVPPPNSKGVR